MSRKQNLEWPRFPLPRGNKLIVYPHKDAYVEIQYLQLLLKYQIFFVAFEAVTCPPLSIPPRAHLLNGSCGDTYGSNCVFGCQTGYVKAYGNETRTCLQTGQWSGNSIYCIGTEHVFIHHIFLQKFSILLY